MGHLHLPLVFLCAAALASASSAATLAMSSDKDIYQVGENIFLTLTGDSQGDLAGIGVRVIVAHDPAFVGALGVVGPIAPEDGEFPDVITQFGAATATRAFHEGECGWAPDRTDQCAAWDQIPADEDFAADAGAEMSVLQYVASAEGMASFAFVDDEGSDFAFFDLGDGDDVGTAPAGVTVTIVPEPSSGAQALAAVLALVGCAALRRGRRA